MTHKKQLCATFVITALLVLPIVIHTSNAQTSQGTVTITATCGLTIPGTIAFGSLDKDTISSEQTVNFANSGSVAAVTTVSGGNWLDVSQIIHISGQLTKFATSNQGPGISYASKTALNSTNGAVTLGTIVPAGNSTYWQLQGTLQNLPFSGALTQNLTFSGSC